MYVSVLLFVIMLLAPIYVTAESNDYSISDRVSKTEDSIKELRRDQLNYKIEKDLLKETYSTNYQTVNIIMGIILLVFTILGFFGIKDVASVKKEYLAELNNLKQLSSQFEEKIKTISIEQSSIKEEFEKSVKINELQNNRIKVLEMQEKISNLMTNKNYSRALEYIAVALSIDATNGLILSQKGLCLIRLAEYVDAIATLEYTLSLEPNNVSNITNLAELYLMTNNVKAFDELYSKHSTLIYNRDNGVIATFFKVLREYTLKDYSTMKNEIKKFISDYQNDKVTNLHWDFSDLYRIISKQNQDENTKLFYKFVDFLKGGISKTDFANVV